MKFGGTSVESEEAVARVTRIVQSYEHRRPVVVVSAMGDTTNKLLRAAQEAEAGRREQALGLVDEVRTQHLTHGLPLAGAAAAELDRYIRAHFEWLEDLVKGLSIVGRALAALHGCHRKCWRTPLKPDRHFCISCRGHAHTIRRCKARYCH